MLACTVGFREFTKKCVRFKVGLGGPAYMLWGSAIVFYIPELTDSPLEVCTSEAKRDTGPDRAVMHILVMPCSTLLGPILRRLDLHFMLEETVIRAWCADCGDCK